jgi:hypothetical protein
MLLHGGRSILQIQRDRGHKHLDMADLFCLGVEKDIAIFRRSARAPGSGVLLPSTLSSCVACLLIVGRATRRTALFRDLGTRIWLGIFVGTPSTWMRCEAYRADMTARRGSGLGPNLEGGYLIWIVETL